MIDLEAARSAVRDEIGSRLCHLTPHGTRICTRQVSSTCLCEETARAALCSQAPTPRCEVRSEALADQIHDACPHKIDEPPNCALVKSRLECVCEHVHMHAIRAARSGSPVLSALVDLHAVARVDRDEDYAAITNAAAVIEAAGSGCVAQACPECDKIAREAWMTNNPDGSVTLDAYHGRSRDELKDRCQELCMALEDWQFAAVSAATDGSNTLENVREPYRSKIGKVIEAYSDGDEGSEVPSAPAQAAWMPIETAPKDGHDILVTRGLGEPSRIAFWDVARGGLWSMWPGRDPILPVYWMPVPRYSVPSADREGK